MVLYVMTYTQLAHGTRQRCAGTARAEVGEEVVQGHAVVQPLAGMEDDRVECFDFFEARELVKHKIHAELHERALEQAFAEEVAGKRGDREGGRDVPEGRGMRWRGGTHG